MAWPASKAWSATACWMCWPGQHRCARGQRRAGLAGIPVRAAAVAGLLPRAGDPAQAGRGTGRGTAACRRPCDRAAAEHDRTAAPLLAADAGDLAAAVAFRLAPAQARVPHPDPSAFPCCVRLPQPAPGGFGRARRRCRVLARGAGAVRPRTGIVAGCDARRRG
ncbi:hypothetical protein G6F31_019067 [Rhizopus arrhizus]|nr:hypothetical protein G6F31_019067 [Rhizopus arrhizus]